MSIKEKDLSVNASEQGYTENGPEALPYGGSGSTAHYSVEIRQQADNDWCGFASMQMVIAAWGLEDKIDGSSDYDKQKTLKDEQTALNLGVESNTGIAGVMASVLNKYIAENNLRYRNYKYYGFYNYDGKTTIINDIDDFEQIVYNALMDNRPVLVRAETVAPLDYYEEKTYTHYLVIDFIDMQRDIVELADCFAYTEDGVTSTEYQGHHMVSLESIYATIDGYETYIIA